MGAYGPAVFAVCPEQQILAYVQRGSNASVNVISAADLQPIANFQVRAALTVSDALHNRATALVQEPTKNEWLHLSVTNTGKRVLSMGGFPHYQLDVWDLLPDLSDMDAEDDDGAAGGPLRSACVASVQLGDRLSAVGVAAFPLNNDVVCTCGERAARLIGLDPLPKLGTLRQADLDFGALGPKETLTTFCWTPNGALLFGTSEGRLLVVQGAAPVALPGQSWAAAAAEAEQEADGKKAALSGPILAPARMLFDPEALHRSEAFGSKTDVGAVASLVLTPTHVVMVTAGAGAHGHSHMVWLDAKDPGTATAVVAPIGGGMRGAAWATLSPSLRHLIVAGSDGRLIMCDSSFVLREPTAILESGEDGEAASLATSAVPVPAVSWKELSRFQGSGVVDMCPMPGNLVATVSSQGRLQVWRHVGPSAAGGGSGVSARIQADCVLEGHTVTCMATCRRRGRPIAQLVVGTASGTVAVVSMESALSSDLPRVSEPSSAADAAAGQALDERIHVRLCWELRPFTAGAVSHVAVSSSGDCCAAACADLGLVAFFRVINSGPEASMQLVGFYHVLEPNLVAFVPTVEPRAAAPSEKQQQGAFSLYAGAPPLLVVASGGSDIVVVQAPDVMYSTRTEDATVPAGTLTRGTLRTQYPVTALAVSLSSGRAASGGDGGGEDGTFWVFAACTDRSVRRYRMLTDAQRNAAKLALAAVGHNPASHAPKQHLLAAAGAQGHQAAEKERVGDLIMLASQLRVCSNDKHLVAACRAGSVLLYNLHDLMAHGRWHLHRPPDEAGAAAAAVRRPLKPPAGGGAGAALEGSTLLTAGGDGLLCVADMVPGSVLAAAAAQRRAASKSSHAGATPGPNRNATPQSMDTVLTGGGATSGFKMWEHLGVAELLVSGPPVQDVSLRTPKVLTWSEAR